MRATFITDSSRKLDNCINVVYNSNQHNENDFLDTILLDGDCDMPISTVGFFIRFSKMTNRRIGLTLGEYIVWL